MLSWLIAGSFWVVAMTLIVMFMMGAHHDDDD